MRPATLIAAAVAASIALRAMRLSERAWGQTAVGPASRSPFHPPSDAEAAQPTRIAAEGYCVVTLHDRQEWQLGDRRVGATFDGCEFFFAGPRERAIFAAAPEKYAPVLGGDCVVTYAETRERVAGKNQYGLMRGGRLYFMASADKLHDFTTDPQRYVDADLADERRCPVTMHDQHRSVPGIPATSATYGGLRYLFASARQRALFLAAPDKYDAHAKPMASSAGATAANGAPAPAKPGKPAEDNADSSGGDHGGEEMLLNSRPLMGGYCPVTIRQTGAWVRGRYDYRVEFGPLVYLTAGPAEHDALMQDPDRYLPALGGDCVVSLVDDGVRARGSIFHASEYQGRLFLFADAHRKATFKADPERYALVDVAADGACVVTQKDDGRTVAGLPQFQAWRNGLIYRFAGAAEKKKFLSTPELYQVEMKAPAERPADGKAAPKDPAAAAEPQSAVAQ